MCQRLLFFGLHCFNAGLHETFPVFTITVPIGLVSAVWTSWNSLSNSGLFSPSSNVNIPLCVWFYTIHSFKVVKILQFFSIIYLFSFILNTTLIVVDIIWLFGLYVTLFKWHNYTTLILPFFRIVNIIQIKSALNNSIWWSFESYRNFRIFAQYEWVCCYWDEEMRIRLFKPCDLMQQCQSFIQEHIS